MSTRRAASREESERWLHPSVRALLEAEDTTEPVEAIQRSVRRLVARARALGWAGPPFDLSELASLRGFVVQYVTALRPDQDACIVPRRILLNANSPAVRQRYSLAHEIVHTLFPDYEREIKHLGTLWRREGDDSEVERLCQIGAAEILFPLPMFAQDLAARGVSLRTVFSLAERYHASAEATARRVADVCGRPVMVLFLRPAEVLGDPTWPMAASRCGHSPWLQLAVSLVHAGESCHDIDIPLGSIPPSQGAAVKAWKRVALAKRSVRTYREREDWSHVQGLGHCTCEAVTLPPGSATPHEVLCLLYLDAGKEHLAVEHGVT